MNFVTVPTEDFDAVSEAISFIDSFPVGLDLDAHGRKSNIFDPPSVSSDSDGQKSGVKGVKRKRRSNPPGYSTRMQQGKKAEIQALRNQVMELEMHPVQLKKLRSSLGGEQLTLVNEAAQSVWRKTAKIEYQERQRSEKTNRKLKSIVSHQQKLNTALFPILGRKAFEQDTKLTTAAKATDPRADAEYSIATITELEDEVAKLYLDLESQFSAGSLATVNTSMKIKRDDARGDSVKILSTTPLHCTVDCAAQSVWKALTTNHALAQCLERGQPGSYVKNWVITLEHAIENKQAKGVQFLRRFEEPDRIVIVKSGVITIPTEGLQFRDQCWMVITRSEASPSESVVHGCGQIFMDPENATCGAQHSTLRSLAFKLREEAQNLQNRLIDDTDNWTLSANERQCV